MNGKDGMNEKLPLGMEWYVKLFENSPVGIFFTDADGNCLHVNQRWCDIAGMKPEEALGRGWVQAIHQDDLSHVASQWYEAAQKNHPFYHEYRFSTPQGKVTWVVGEARSVNSEDGDIIGYIGTITDITSSKKMYSALRQSKEQAQTIIEHMPVLLFAFDNQGCLAAWNREAERLTGYRAKDLVGNPDAMKILCPDKEYRREMLNHYKQLGDDYLHWEWSLTAKDGSQKIIAFSNISAHHPIDGWANWGVGIDITEMRDKESKLRERIKELNCLYRISLFSNRHDLDLDQFLQEVVEILPASWQYPDITCARIIYDDRIFMTERFATSEWKLASSLHVRGRKVGSVEVYYLQEKPTIAEGPFLLEERLLIDEVSLQLSRTIGHLLARQDLTLLDELSTKADELERFTHTVSHDLRTPLAAIGGFADFLNRQINKGNLEEARSCSQRIIDITARMEHRLNELLKLAKIGKIIDPKDQVHLGELVEEAIDLAETQIEKKNVSVVIEGDFPKVIGDRVRLTEVIENLLDNAIKYIGDSPNEITIGCRQEEGEKVLYVMDNGIGIDPEHFDDVFQLFWRLNKKADGDGTGLSIVKRIIDAHGGRIWVESEGKEKGTCFCFTLGHVID